MSYESVTNPIAKTGTKACRPCTGGLRPDEKETTDDSSWYVVIVRQRNELVSRRILDGMKNLDFQFSTIQKKELNIYGSRNALKDDFLELIDAVKEGRVDISKIVTNVYDFDEAPRAFEEFDKNAGQMLKVILKF